MYTVIIISSKARLVGVYMSTIHFVDIKLILTSRLDFCLRWATTSKLRPAGLLADFSFQIWNFIFVSRRESVVFSSSCQFTTSVFRPSKIDCLTTSDGFKFGFLWRDCSTTEGRGTLLFVWQVCVYRRSKHEPLEGRAGTPCTSSNTGNKDGASSTTFIDHITIPVFLELDFIGFAMLLLERTFWVLALVRSFTVLGAYWVVFRPFPLDWHIPIPGSPIGNSLQSLVLLVRELIKIFSVYTKGKTVDFHNRSLFPETFEDKFPQFLPCATDYWFISILTNFVEQGSSGDYPFQQCCTSASLFVKCV